MNVGMRNLYHCRRCDYEAMVSNGRDRGFMAVTETRTCDNCNEVIDVLIGSHGMVLEGFVYDGERRRSEDEIRAIFSDDSWYAKYGDELGRGINELGPIDKRELLDEVLSLADEFGTCDHCDHRTAKAWPARRPCPRCGMFMSVCNGVDEVIELWD